MGPSQVASRWVGQIGVFSHANRVLALFIRSGNLGDRAGSTESRIGVHGGTGAGSKGPIEAGKRGGGTCWVVDNLLITGSEPEPGVDKGR